MRRFHVPKLAVCLLVLAAIGCVPSSNKDKIEGTKWVSDSIEFGGQRFPPGSLYLHFRIDNTLLFRVGNKSIKGTYSLGPASLVTINLDEALPNGKTHVEQITIDEKKMTMTDLNGTKATFRKGN